MTIPCCRGGIYDVLPEEPHCLSPGSAVQLEDNFSQPAYQGPTLLNQAGAYSPADTQELEDVRARLEKLLPSEDV